MPDAPPSSRRARVESSSQRFNKLPPSALSASLRENRPGPSTTPRTGRAFWTAKMRANIARDRFVNRQLRRLGWTVIRIWEHELGKASERCVRRVLRALM